VTLISMCSVAGVSVMPFMGKKLYKNILTVLIGLAVGSLVGSSLFHLIPQVLLQIGIHSERLTLTVIGVFLLSRPSVSLTETRIPTMDTSSRPSSSPAESGCSSWSKDFSRSSWSTET
jgi:uncharacterized membrane protein YfcA